MRFFFDTNVPPKIVKSLRILCEGDGHEYIGLNDRYSQDTKDPEWLKALGAEGDYVVISGDVKISRNPGNRQAWHESGLTAFFFADGWTSQSMMDKAADVIGRWREIVRMAKEGKKGSGFQIPKKREIRLFHDPEQLDL